METLNRLLLDLLAIDSVTGTEENICSAIEDLIGRRVSDRAGRLQYARHENALIVSTTIDPSKPTIGFIGHLDTVPGTDTGAPIGIEGDRIVGLGASDMKGGLAVMLELLTPEVLDRARVNIIELFYDREEGPYLYNGIHGAVRQWPLLNDIDLCFVLEPTDLELALGCMGLINAKVTFYGKRAHSASPWLGDNAIYKAIPFLQAAAASEPRQVKWEGIIYQEVLAVTLASGGTATNVIPDLFALNLNMRLAPGTTLERGQHHLAEMCGDLAQFEITDSAPSCPIPHHNPLLDDFRRRYQLPERPFQAYNDAAVIAQLGVDTVTFGPGLLSQAHQAGEYIPCENLHRAYQILRDFVTHAPATANR